MSRKFLTLVALPVSKQLLLKSSNGAFNQLPVASSSLLSQLLSSRSLSTKALSPTLTFISNEPIKHLRNRPDLSNFSSEGRPLSILLCWLMAKNNAVKKYAQFYLDRGFDVLTVRITPTQLLLPSRCEPIVLNEILPTLMSSDHEKKLIHGFSVGGYVFARMLKYMQEHPDGQELMRTIKGQVWDSVVDVNGVSIGVSKSVFMNSPFFQQALHNYIEFHMKAFHNIATKYYLSAHDYYYYKPLHTPALFLSSEIDQISTIDVVQEVQKGWTSKGIFCENKVWPNTSHVGHMRAYPEEYKTILANFIDKNGMKPERRVVRERVRDERVIPEGYPNVVYSKAI